MKLTKKRNYTLNSIETYELAMKLRKEKGLSPNKVYLYLCEQGVSCSLGAITGWVYGSKKPFVKRIITQIPESSKELTIEKAYILGTLCGDGWMSTGYRVGLDVCDKEFANYFQSCLESVYRINCSNIERIEKPTNFCDNPKNRHCVMMVSKLAFQDLQRYDSSFKTNTWLVPKQIMSASKEIQASFIRAFADSEASVRFRKGRSEMTLCSGNTEGLRMIKEMLFSTFGIESGEGTNGAKVAIIRISKYIHLKKFYDEIGFVINRKQEALKKVVESYNRKELRTYSEDFKSLAKELLNQGLDYMQVARLLETSPANVYGWEKKWREEAKLL